MVGLLLWRIRALLPRWCASSSTPSLHHLIPRNPTQSYCMHLHWTTAREDVWEAWVLCEYGTTRTATEYRPAATWP